MLSPEIIIAIAVWCGEPINSTKGAAGFKTGVEITVQQVNDCRKQLIACMEREPLVHVKSDDCFKSNLHAGND